LQQRVTYKRFFLVKAFKSFMYPFLIHQHLRILDSLDVCSLMIRTKPSILPIRWKLCVRCCKNYVMIPYYFKSRDIYSSLSCCTQLNTGIAPVLNLLRSASCRDYLWYPAIRNATGLICSVTKHQAFVSSMVNKSRMNLPKIRIALSHVRIILKIFFFAQD
jgi:hypothetical protein